MQDSVRDNIRVLGSHWNRNTVKKAKVSWNEKIGKWEIVVKRHLGYFDSASEAGEFLTQHLNGVEEWWLERLENGEGSIRVIGVKAQEKLT